MITLLELHLEVTMVMKMECGKATMLQETLECRKSRQEKKIQRNGNHKKINKKRFDNKIEEHRKYKYNICLPKIVMSTSAKKSLGFLCKF